MCQQNMPGSSGILGVAFNRWVKYRVAISVDNLWSLSCLLKGGFDWWWPTSPLLATFLQCSLQYAIIIISSSQILSFGVLGEQATGNSGRCLWNLVLTVNSYNASHDSWCTGTLLNRIVAAQWEGMGDVGLARYEPALLPPCPTIWVLSYSNRQRSTYSILSEFSEI